MAKISRSEFLGNIRNLINESMNETADFDGTEKFGIRKYVTALVEAGSRNPKLMSFLLEYDRLLTEGVKDFTLFNSFGQGLGQFAKGNREVKAVLEQMNNTLEQSGNELETYMTIDNIAQPYAQKVIREAYDAYVYDKCPETMTNLVESLDLLYENEPANAQKLNVLVTEERYCTLEPFGNYMNESAFEDLSRKMAKDNEDKKFKQLREKIENYASEVFDNAVREKEEMKNQLNLKSIANSNGIGLTEAIKIIANSDAKKNSRLMETVDQYAGAIANGAYEERLYETFMTNLQKYTYLLPVERAIKHIAENVEKRNLPIMITKILEEMSESMSYYIVPLIEEDCARFVKTPSATNRVQMRNALVAHAADPYVYAMLEAIDRDDTLANASISESAINIKDQIKMVRQDAHVCNMYSPVQYIKENECVFNANGRFYLKKGNCLSLLDESYVSQLSEKFISLCQLVNDPRVAIDDDKIVFATNDKVAYIYEGYVDINGERESADSLRDLKTMCLKHDFDTDFYITCSCLHENFNNIAKINFAKHVALNENEGLNFDIFRLGDRIFINTVNEAVSNSTFFHDVNPIQCKNIINSHMGLNVSSLFEDLLPTQEKIIMKLNETQEAYTKAIEQYEQTIEKLEKAQEECVSEENSDKLECAIKDAKQKLEAIKGEYKHWQKEAEKVTGEDMDGDSDEGSDDTRKEVVNEPIDSSDVEDVMADLTTPIDDETGNTDTMPEDDAPISDDEFSDYLGADGSDEDTLPLANAQSDAEDDEDVIDGDTPEDDIDTDIDDDLMGQEADTEIDMVDNGEPENGEEDVITEPADDEIPVNEPATDEPAAEDDDEATDEFGGDTRDPLDINNTVEDDELDNAEVSNDNAFKITSVMFDENIKTGEKYKSGTVSVIIPMVSGDGKKYIQANDYNFYLNDNGDAVLDNEEMPAELYTEICAAIKADPSYAEFANAEAPASPEDGADAIAEPADEPAEPAKAEEINIDDFNTGDDDELEITDGDTEWSVKLPEGDDAAEIADDAAEAAAETAEDDAIADTVADDAAEITAADLFAGLDDSDDETSDAVDDVIIPTYKSGNTEIELPAANVDDTIIPESKQAKGGKSVNEARKSIIGISAEIKRNGKSFFVNEGAIKPSKNGKKGDTTLVNEVVDGGINSSSASEPTLSDYNGYMGIEVEADVFQKMHDKAEFAKLTLASNGHIVKVTPIDDEEDDTISLRYFTIEDRSSAAEIDSYTVFECGGKIYYRPSSEFYQILRDIEDGIPGATLELELREYNRRKKLSGVSERLEDDCVFIINSIMQSLTGCVIDNEDGRSVNESCKIRKPKLGTNSFEESKFADDAQHGDKEKRDFEEKIEKETQKDGVENPLAAAPQQDAQFIQQETTKMRLPNAHSITEQYEIEYEPMDKVVYKGEKGEVLNVSDDGEVINLLIGGQTVEVKPKDLEPDPAYFKGIAIDQFNIGKDRLVKDAENEKPAKMNDLNGNAIGCNIMVDGHQLNMYECRALLADVADSKRKIHVVLESGDTDEFDVDNIQFTENPYAVIVDGDGKPVRTIKVDPVSYIEAEEGDLVKCQVGPDGEAKETELPKTVIKILS